MDDTKEKTAEVMATETTGHLKRKLLPRHLEMIAIGGTIGTGLLLKSGHAINSAGPLGALICFALVGIQVYGVAASIGEMCTFIPVEGAFSALPARFLSPAFGFMSGYNYWMNWVLTFPAELTGIATLMSNWVPTTTVAGWVWSLVFMIPLVVLNCFPVTGFAEVEFVLCIIKIFAIVLFMIIALLLWFGVKSGYALGFSNWNPAIVGDTDFERFLNTSGAFTTAFFAYGGTELVALTSGEAANPRKAVPRAINGTFYRIIIFYLGSLFLVGVLLDADNAANSPFVYAYQTVGISFGYHFMNAVAIVAAASAGNSSIYASARTLMRLAEDGLAPRFAGKVDNRGVPLFSVFFSTVVGAICIIAAYADGSGDVFNWLSNLISYSIMLCWVVMSYAQLRFRTGYVAQGYKLEDLPYRMPGYPYTNYVSLTIGFVVTVFMLLGAFYPTSDDFFNHDWYINNSWVYAGIPLSLLLFFCYGLFVKGSMTLVRYEDMDFETGKFIESPEMKAENDLLKERPKNLKEWGQRIWFKLF
ncbi:hypothetical protein HDU83_000425 [Entophlyctis luteolus]|nr:hypothetical protein HDU83_000425 [Entophlyctis luteolus]KAJ3392594.1 hypothetical protein HDU84_003843 [Entophlyctis sp. JEL0112]